MATYAPRPLWALRSRALSGARAGLTVTALGLGGLLAVSVVLRTHHMGVGYWIDEGLSVGIADRPLTSIPGLLRQDGSPPLYYTLLSLWIALVGSTGESATHALSLVFGLLAFGGVLLLYAPWLPTLAFQAAHTGAPWSDRPALTELTAAPARLLGAVGQVALLLAGGAGVAAVLGRRRVDAEARAVLVLIVVFVLTVVFPWTVSQVSPGWAARYLAVALPPLLLLSAFGLARAGRMGLVGLALVALMWSGSTGRSEKSNVQAVAEAVAPSLRPGDLVISTQPEQIPVLAHYLPAGLQWATLWGRVADLGVTDWRDGVDRLEATSAPRDLAPLLDRLAPGRRLVLVQPTIYDLNRWSAPWTSLVRVRSEAWARALGQDPRFRVSAISPPSPFPEHPNPVRAMVMIKQAPS